MFDAKDSKVADQQLKVQELTIREADHSLYTETGGDIVVHIGEAVDAVVCAYLLDNSAAGSAGLITFAAAALTVTGTGDTDITIDTAAMDANDVLVVKYVTAR